MGKQQQEPSEAKEGDERLHSAFSGVKRRKKMRSVGRGFPRDERITQRHQRGVRQEAAGGRRGGHPKPAHPGSGLHSDREKEHPKKQGRPAQASAAALIPPSLQVPHHSNNCVYIFLIRVEKRSAQKRETPGKLLLPTWAGFSSVQCVPRRRGQRSTI